jgi:hypothetical protein
MLGSRCDFSSSMPRQTSATRYSGAVQSIRSACCLATRPPTENGRRKPRSAEGSLHLASGSLISSRSTATRRIPRGLPLGVCADPEGTSMTPQFLRSEAARFREMADAVTDREASRQRLLAMAADYEARAEAAAAAQPIEVQTAEPELVATPPDGAIEGGEVSKKPPSDRRLRLSRKLDS